MASKIHKLKTDYKWFDLVYEGRKTAEIRLNDRDYKAGDIIVLQRLFKGVVGASEVWARITHVLTSDDFNILPPGYVMLSFERLPMRDVYLLYEGMQLGAQSASNQTLACYCANAARAFLLLAAIRREETVVGSKTKATGTGATKR